MKRLTAGMNWSNVKLILAREVRDQLRDRRTLFMIAVLPILLYPLLGMSFFQIAQFLREQPTSVLVVSASHLGELPVLVEDGEFAERLFEKAGQRRLLQLTFSAGREGEQAADPRADLRAAVERGDYDAAVYFPPDFAQRLEDFREKISKYRQRAAGETAPTAEIEPQIPSPEVFYTTASEKSQLAYARLAMVLRRWTEEIGAVNLAAGGVPPNAARPFDVETADVAEEQGRRGAAFWSKILPVLLLLWAMTGAFYPAVDLCAGEKERGTLETLLSSPAERSEIVLGKLLTIMIFSMVTAVLNLISMGITGLLLLTKMPQVGGPPPWTAVAWLAIALVPIAAMFSALCLALAAFARSTKEGQYYLMPLLLVTMPLVMLPMAPAVELNLGNSLIPVTGVVLVLRALLDGNYLQAVQFLPPVAVVTLGCCYLSIRWAVDQFNSESVLFRESERLDVGLRLRHLMQDRRPTPSVAEAVFCGVVILVVQFFLSSTLPAQPGFRGTVVLVLVSQLVVILTPALLMTIMLTSNPRETLLVRWPAWTTLPAAAALAVALNPVVTLLGAGVMRLYPLSEEIKRAIAAVFPESPAFWQLVLLMAVVPAVCEELAFRGFLLAGFRHLGNKWRAIFYSALFFGLSHTLLQQSIIAWLVGLVIGLVAVQTGSILPGMVFHIVHNTLGLAIHQVTVESVRDYPVLAYLANPSDDTGVLYHWPIVLLGAIAATLLIAWFLRQPYRRSEEEARREALDGWPAEA